MWKIIPLTVVVFFSWLVVRDMRCLVKTSTVFAS